jgi:hypothetical protein
MAPFSGSLVPRCSTSLARLSYSVSELTVSKSNWSPSLGKRWRPSSWLLMSLQNPFKFWTRAEAQPLSLSLLLLHTSNNFFLQLVSPIQSDPCLMVLLDLDWQFLMKKRLGNCQNWCRKGRIGLIIRAYTPRPRPSVVCFTHIFSPVHLLISLYQCSRCAAPGHRVGWKIAGRTLRRGSGPLWPKIVCRIQSKISLSLPFLSVLIRTCCKPNV